MKVIGLYLLAVGLLFLVLSSIYSGIFKIKKVKLEIDAINRRAMLSTAYTEDLDNRYQKEEEQTDFNTSVLDSTLEDEYKTTLL